MRVALPPWISLWFTTTLAIILIKKNLRQFCSNEVLTPLPDSLLPTGVLVRQSTNEFAFRDATEGQPGQFRPTAPLASVAKLQIWLMQTMSN